MYKVSKSFWLMSFRSVAMKVKGAPSLLLVLVFGSSNLGCVTRDLSPKRGFSLKVEEEYLLLKSVFKANFLVIEILLSSKVDTFSLVIFFS